MALQAGVWVISFEEALVGAGEVSLWGSIESTLAESLVGARMIMGWEKGVIEIVQKSQPLHPLSSHSLFGICSAGGSGGQEMGRQCRPGAAPSIFRRGPWEHKASPQAQEVGPTGW